MLKDCEGLPEEVRSSLQDKFYDIIYVGSCQINALNDIREALCGAEIPFILFKGSVLRDYYPVPESRIMSDIDILITQEKRNAAKNALESIGFKCKSVNGTVREYSRQGIKLEVHTRLFSEFGENAFDDAFENSVFLNDGGFEKRLDTDYHFAYLIAHIARHFKFYGAGIRMILDLAFFRMKNDVDISKVMDILSKIRLDTFAKEILTLCRKWFGFGEDFDRDVSKTEEYLLSYGAFGGLNENKGAIIARKNLEDGKSISSPFMRKLRLAFPSYSRMKNIDYIKFIEGRPWLTPYAWAYRFFYNFKNRKTFVKKTIKNLDENNIESLAVAELKYFEEIGLWNS